MIQEENIEKETKYKELNNKLSKLLEDYDITSSQLKEQKEQNEKYSQNLNETNKKYNRILRVFILKEMLQDLLHLIMANPELENMI